MSWSRSWPQFGQNRTGGSTTFRQRGHRTRVAHVQSTAATTVTTSQTTNTRPMPNLASMLVRPHMSRHSGLTGVATLAAELDRHDHAEGGPDDRERPADPNGGSPPRECQQPSRSHSAVPPGRGRPEPRAVRPPPTMPRCRSQRSTTTSSAARSGPRRCRHFPIARHATCRTRPMSSSSVAATRACARRASWRVGA